MLKKLKDVTIQDMIEECAFVRQDPAERKNEPCNFCSVGAFCCLDPEEILNKMSLEKNIYLNNVESDTKTLKESEAAVDNAPYITNYFGNVTNYYSDVDSSDHVDESSPEKCKIYFGKLKQDAQIPTFGRTGDGCMDIFPCFDGDCLIIEAGTVKLVPTGICSSFPSDYRISIRERGSNTKSTTIVMAGQIDSNYTGEWFVALYNGNTYPVIINKRTDTIHKDAAGRLHIPYTKAIAQCAVEFVPKVEIEELPSDVITNRITNRGDGKLGSSGR